MIASRKRGAWFGLAVGDALGAPVEFLAAAEIARRHGRVTEMMSGGPWLAGEWTDDTALALATAEAYAGDTFHPERAGKAMVEWLASGPKDVGNLTRVAIQLIASGKATAYTAGPMAIEGRRHAAGNGSVMRAAPTALVRAPGDPRLVAESIALSAITHADPRCTASCVAFNVALSALVHRGVEPRAALERARAAVEGLDPDVQKVIEGVLKGAPPRHQDAPIGFVLLCLERAFVALRDADSFEDGILEVVNEGGDADTNGAVAGALLGGRFGYDSIPARWLRDLHEKDPIEGALARLLDAS